MGATEKFPDFRPQKGHVLEHVTGCFSKNQEAMSTTKAVTQERTASLANQLTNAIARSFTLGIDDAGYTHHYYHPADAVVVFNGRELNHYQPLAGRTLDSWKQFVAQERGWTSFGQLAQIGLQADSKRKGTQE